MSQTQHRTIKISMITATTIVAANMIGTGVFTSLGFQVGALQHGFTILALWALGGLTALSGALVYGEIGAALPRSGGEYHFLSRIYHPLAGFLSGWVSLIAGFSAPIAAAAMAAGKYSTQIFVNSGHLSPNYQGLAISAVAVGLCLAIMAVHLRDLRTIGRFQKFFTALKIMLILVLIGFGFWLAQPQDISFAPSRAAINDIFTGAFAISLVFVMYAYSGWNASAYVAEEISRPERNLPRSLFLGTLLVMLLYVPVNAVFLYAAPVDAIVNKEEVGYIAAGYIFGPAGGGIMAGLIALGLISSISSMTWAGPRVIQVMGEDTHILHFLSRKNKRGIPAVAVFTQTALAIFMVITSTFEAVIYYIGFILTLSALLTVLGVYVLRWKQPDLPRPVKTWGYPLTPLFFAGISGWMLFYVVKEKPEIALYGLLTLLAGTVLYFINKKIEKKQG